MSLPTAAPMIFFLLAAVWFGRAAGRMSTPAGDRLTNGYYAVMMAAMAWMFAAMNGRLPTQFGDSSDHAQSAAAAMDMSGADMPAHEMSSAEHATQWIAAVNWIAAFGFALVALYWACRYLAKRRTIAEPHAAQLAHLEPLHQVCSAAGYSPDVWGAAVADAANSAVKPGRAISRRHRRRLSSQRPGLRTDHQTHARRASRDRGRGHHPGPLHGVAGRSRAHKSNARGLYPQQCGLVPRTAKRTVRLDQRSPCWTRRS